MLHSALNPEPHMPSPHVMTPALGKVHAIALDALNRADGVRIPFRVSVHGSLAAARAQARNFSNTFASLRSRERRKASKIVNSSMAEQFGLDKEVAGRFDKLSLLTTAMPDGEGFYVSLLPVAHCFIDIEVIDIASGERVEAFNSNEQRKDAIWSIIWKEANEAPEAKRAMINPLNADEERWLFAHYGEYATAVFTDFGIHRQHEELIGLAPAESNDIADVELDDDFGG